MTAPLHVVCPQCHRTNRFPADRRAEEARCGGCKGPLFTGRPLALGKGTFDSHVGRSNIPVIVDFWAPWCAPCRMMEAAFEQAAAALEPRARLAKVNTDEEQGLGSRFSIKGIPTVIIFKEGREVERRSGAMDYGTLVGWIEGHL